MRAKNDEADHSRLACTIWSISDKTVLSSPNKGNVDVAIEYLSPASGQYPRGVS